MGLGRARWHGTQGLPPPFRRPLCPSWRVGFAPIPTKSGASRASGWILGSWSRRRPGPATASQSLQQSAELVAQDQRRPPAGHCRRHNQQSGELVDQGQQIEVSAGHEPEDVAPVSSSTRASDASDARRSHRSVEGDEKPHGERERHTHREKTPILYKSVWIYRHFRSRPVWGAGGGLARDFEHHHHVVHLGLGRARWPGAQGLPPPCRRPLCPSWRAGFSPTPTKSGASRTSGLICGSWERRRPGPASAASRSLQKIVGAIVGAASRAGREHLQGSSPPDIHLKPDSGRPRRSGPAPLPRPSPESPSMR